MTRSKFQIKSIAPQKDFSEWVDVNRKRRREEQQDEHHRKGQPSSLQHVCLTFTSQLFDRMISWFLTFRFPLRIRFPSSLLWFISLQLHISHTLEQQKFSGPQWPAKPPLGFLQIRCLAWGGVYMAERGGNVANSSYLFVFQDSNITMDTYLF